MFSTGLRAGEAVAGSWIDTYKQQKNTNFQGLMAKERASMEESFQQEQRMGDEIAQENKLFQDMSGTDVAHLVAQSMVENGINIDNEMYSMIDKVGTFWEDKKQKRLLFEDKRLINDQKVLNYRNQIEVRDAGNARREAVFNRQSTGTWNPSGRRTVTGGTPAPTNAGFEAWAEEKGETIPTSKTNRNKLYAIYTREKFPYKYPKSAPKETKEPTIEEPKTESISTKDKSRFNSTFEYDGYWYEIDGKGNGTREKL